MSPVPLRKLKAQMVLRDLSVRDVSTLSGVPYATTSQILNGKLVQPEFLQRIKRAIHSAPLPQEAAV